MPELPPVTRTTRFSRLRLISAPSVAKGSLPVSPEKVLPRTKRTPRTARTSRTRGRFPCPCSPCSPLGPFSFLPADHQDCKRVGQNRGPRARLLRGGGGRRAELGGDQVDGVRLLVEGHGAGALARGDVLGHGEAVGRLLADHGQRGVAAVRAEEEAR